MSAVKKRIDSVLSKSELHRLMALLCHGEIKDLVNNQIQILNLEYELKDDVVEAMTKLSNRLFEEAS